MIYKKWWFWVILILGVIGGIVGSMEENSSLNSITNYTNEEDYVSSNSNGDFDRIDQNLVGTWINQKERHLLKKLVLNADGTGFWDSEQITWHVEQGNFEWDKIFFEFSYRSYDQEYTFEEGKLRLTNGCRLMKIDGKKETTLSSLVNTRWIPDFVSYPNNYHVDNPVLKLVYVSIDEKKLIFADELGVSYAATTDNGWRYFFEDDELFYGFSLYGLDPEEGYDVPTMFVDVTDGGWYTVIYKLEE